MLAAPQITFATTQVGANLTALVAVLLVGVELDARDLAPLWSPLIVVPPLLVLGQLMPKALVQTHADAVVDALAELGIEHLDMPLTPERLWQAIRAAAGSKAA